MRDTTNQINIEVIEVRGYAEPSIYVHVSYGGDTDNIQTTMLSGWRHFFGHFGGMLPLTDCVIHVNRREDR